MLILGIETSCDETAAAVVEDGQTILSNVVSSQVKLHTPYGGVVPEIASRAHIEKIIPVIQEALFRAGIQDRELDAIVVTIGPGLVTSLMIGVDTARTLAFAWKKPLIGVNHIEGHIVSIRLKAKSEKRKAIKLPAVCLTVSGGHTMLVLVKDWGNYQVIGETLDDACGEAFDKIAKLLGLGYPGGPEIEKMARRGNPEAFAFPRPILTQDNFDFSFSGLKTAVLYEVRKIIKEKFHPVKSFALNKRKSLISFNRVKDICASFQASAFEVLLAKTLKAARKFRVKSIILTGGVAANQTLQKLFKNKLRVTSYELRITDFPTDNAAMIAAAAYPRAIKKDYVDWHSLEAQANLHLV